MIILQVNVNANWASTGRIAEDIGIAAQEAGFESWIAYGRHAKPSSSRLIKIGSKWNVWEHVLESRLFDNHGLASRGATKNLIKDVQRIRPDIIHLHNIHGYYLNYEILFDYLSKADIPVVWTLHDCWSFTGHCSFFDIVKCDQWKKQCSNCPAVHLYPQCIGKGNVTNNFNKKKRIFNSVKKLTIVSVSRWLDELVNESFLKAQPHFVIHNGIDTETFSPVRNTDAIRERHGLKANETMLLGVASPWSDRKGLSDFIELGKRLPSSRKIVLIGLTKKQMQGLPSNMIGLERVDSASELASYYSAADIVLNLSREESFGLASVEGFSCGTPGIGYNSTATPELFTEDTGIIVSEGDIDGLGKAVELISSRGKSFYSENCRKHAIALFDKKDRLHDYIDLYHKILKTA